MREEIDSLIDRYDRRLDEEARGTKGTRRLLDRVVDSLRAFGKRHLPRACRATLRAVWEQGRTLYWNHVRKTNPPIPPYRLRLRVSDPRLEYFLVQGRRQVGDLRGAVEGSGRRLASFRRALEFGCGPGRQSRWLWPLLPSAELWGCDVHAPTIAWNQRHLAFGRFFANAPEPPLPAADAQFDLIVAVSVFTHLDEHSGAAWLEELHRVAAPGGVVVITLHGPRALALHSGATWTGVSLEALGDLDESGFAFVPYADAALSDGRPRYGMSYHSHARVQRMCSAFFSVASLLPAGLEGHQDIVVLFKT